MSKIIYLNDYRPKNVDENMILKHRATFLTYDKLSLLEAMVGFNDAVLALGYLTKELILQGIPLFEILERSAETSELRGLARDKSRHLRSELKALSSNIRTNHTKVE